MFDKVLDMVKRKDLVIPSQLFYNLNELNINYDELYVLVYVINLNNLEFDMVKMSEELKMKPKDLLKILNSLDEKNYMKLEVVRNGNDASECFNMEGLYNKITFNLIGKEEEKKIDENDISIYDTFEEEFKRLLTPSEIQIINAWLEVGYSKELVVLALKEAAYNGAYSVNYIDKVLSAWDKKGIKNADDVERNRQEFKKKKNEPAVIEEEYDWLNE